MRDMAEMGLSPENCEQWFERAVMVFVGVMFVIIIVRVSKRYFSLQGRRTEPSMHQIHSCILSS
jgi:hypothetical protein